MIDELARQLDSWRSLLPAAVQWFDDDKLDFPGRTPMGRLSSDRMFVVDRGSMPVAHHYNLDIVTAQLRTRFYYAKFTIYRPFVYKVLHFPSLVSPKDAEACALAIKAACLWPLSMAPPRDKKRLVPHLFTWTQNSLCILLILLMTAEDPSLKGICKEQVDRKEMEETASLLLAWLRDIKQVDGIADWCWRILSPLYTNPDV